MVPDVLKRGDYSNLEGRFNRVTISYMNTLNSLRNLTKNFKDVHGLRSVSRLPSLFL